MSAAGTFNALASSPRSGKGPCVWLHTWSLFFSHCATAQEGPIAAWAWNGRVKVAEKVFAALAAASDFSLTTFVCDGCCRMWSKSARPEGGSDGVSCHRAAFPKV